MTEEYQEEHEEQEGQELDIETRARLMGHVALKDFKGDPDKWIPAEEFVRRADELLPIAQAANKTLERKLDKVEKRFKQMSDTLEKFNEYHQTALQKEQAKAAEEYQRGLEEAQGKMRDAVELGDTEMFDEAKATQDKLIKQAATLDEAGNPPDNGKPKIDPEINRVWMEENPWFIKNFKMNKFAKECGDQLAFEQPELTQKQQLAEIAKMVKEEYPDYFATGNSNRDKADTVGGGDKTAAPVGGRRRTYNDLPATAKAMCDSFVRDIKGYTKDQYLAQYNGPWKS